MSLCPNNSVDAKKEREFWSRELPTVKWSDQKQKKNTYTFPYPGFTFMAQNRNKDRWNLNVFAMKMFWNFIRISSPHLFGPLIIQFISGNYSSTVIFYWHEKNFYVTQSIYVFVS